MSIDITVAGRRLSATPLGDGRLVLAFDNVMGRAPDGGIAHRLARYTYPDLTLVDEVLYGLPSCCVDSVAVSASGRLALTRLESGQGQGGYEVFSLDGPLRRLGIGELFTLRSMFAGSVFSPSERYVACCPGLGGTGDAWWSPPEEQWRADWEDDEWEIPSLGGLTDFATVVLHDLDRDVVTRHRLAYLLEPGWVPDDPEDSRWHYGALQVAFVDDARLRLTLADGASVELSLPLPDVTTLTAPPRALERDAP